MKDLNLAPLDAADYLDSEEVIAEYLSAALEDPNPDVFLTALKDVIKAKGMTNVAREAGIGCESLYKTLTPRAHPRYETISKLLTVVGVKLQVASI
ncbi:putative addiction module antidote protein [Prodigiosinella aquatilis]|nr:addiction module antidote protein [Prodigiosinella sp. LS101]WJV53616.1 putative addiction module antidote protein [Prodigiosinella sp. LS101]WJV57975.1 putative addiction module antidote protein [Pectobacteriaceae bacterium C111]